MNSKQIAFFKVPKKLLLNEKFKKLNPSNRVIIIYLLSLTNSFKKTIFYQKPKIFLDNIGLQRSTILRSKCELESLGIFFSKKGNLWQFNLCLFLDNFLDYDENLSKKLISSLQNANVS